MATTSTPTSAHRAETLIHEAGQVHAHLSRDEIHRLACAPDPVRAALNILINDGALANPVSSGAIAARLLATWLWAFNTFVNDDSTH